MAPLALACYGQSNLNHSRVEFHLTVNLPYAEAAPLFGALAEQKWAPDWRPRFLYPEPPADQEGAVFKVEHGAHSSIWVTSRFDLAAGRIQYVYLLDRILVTRIDLSLSRNGADRTDVSVVYERTALDPGANEHIETLAKHDAEAGPEWQAQLNAYAAKLKSH
jgi:hypothetical protein